MGFEPTFHRFAGGALAGLGYRCLVPPAGLEPAQSRGRSSALYPIELRRLVAPRGIEPHHQRYERCALTTRPSVQYLGQGSNLLPRRHKPVLHHQSFQGRGTPARYRTGEPRLRVSAHALVQQEHVDRAAHDGPATDNDASAWTSRS